MNEKLTVREQMKALLIECLTALGEATGREMAEWVVKNRMDWCKDRIRKFKKEAASINEALDNGNYKPLEDKMTWELLDYTWQRSYIGRKKDPGDTRFKYFLINPEETPKAKETSKEKEEDLYKPFKDYLLNILKVQATTINATTSKHAQQGQNEWLHPDIVGVQDVFSGWDHDAQDCAGKNSVPRYLFWSVEVKITIEMSNMRKCFFQAVSNSSWAHFGYLAAGKIEPDALEKLNILCPLHGIGLIEINKDQPEESTILIQAKQRSQVDWASVNELCVNKDFKKFLCYWRR